MTHPELSTKHCFACDEWKPVDAFHRDKKRPDGRYPTCIACYRIRRAGYRPARITGEARDAVLQAIPAAAIERFWSKHKRNGECLEFQGWRDEDGYGRFSIGAAQFPAHRVAYAIANGPIPDDMMVLHTCDNPPCDLPEHLFLGTNIDNIDDRTAKGRSSRGEAHPHSRLTEAQVIEIRQRYEPGNGTALAREFGIKQPQVSSIVHRHSWRHVP